MTLKKFVFLVFPFLLCGCEVFEYHPYDVQVIGNTDINIKNINRIEASCAGKDTICFVLIGDTQGGYDETRDFVNILNSRDDVDFVIHGGDFSNYGVTQEFLWMRDILDGLKVPYVGIIGNHDCIGTGTDVYRKIFGDENFAFKAGRLKFICLNTNALEYDYSNPIPDFNFMESHLGNEDELKLKTYFVMHAKPFSDQFNNNVARPFKHYLEAFPNIQFCLNAHDHQITVDDVFEDGTLYYGCENIEKRSYLLFTIKPDDYEYEVVRF